MGGCREEEEEEEEWGRKLHSNPLPVVDVIVPRLFSKNKLCIIFHQSS